MNIKKTITGGLITTALVGGVIFSNNGNDKVKYKKLKADKSKILTSELVDYCIEYKEENGVEKELWECKKTKKIKKYDYISDVKVPIKKIKYKGKDLIEDISKRKGNAIFFEIKDDNTSMFVKNAYAADKVEYLARFYGGTPFMQDGDDWYQTETATATIEDYKSETATTTSEVIKSFVLNLFGLEAMADTATYYPSAGDGYSYYRQDTAVTETAFHAVHDQTSGNDTSYTGTTMWNDLYMDNKPATRILLARLFLPFTGIPQSVYDNITSAKIKMYYTDGTDDYSSYVVFTSNDQASATTLVNDDYDELGTTEYSDKINIADLTASQYNEFDLTVAGINSIGASAYFGLRDKYDITDTYPGTPGSGLIERSFARFSSSEETGTDQDPYLEIIYTPSETRRIMQIN